LPMRPVSGILARSTCRATVSVFVTVTDCAALATFVVSLPNAKTVGDTVKGGATPVPLSTTVCVPAPLPALSCRWQL